MNKVRLILNGKKAGLAPVRDAIYEARKQGDIDVRVTWEQGDVLRLTHEACEEGCTRLIVGGGDGTVKEIVDALMRIDSDKRPELAIMPLGTANDFASACQIPTDLSLALFLAQTGQAHAVDSVKTNKEYYINVASAGFGAQVTTNTPVELKNFLGGGAYTLNGLVQALNFQPYEGLMSLPGVSFDGKVIIGAVCNGRQAGGGQQLAPQALINDGLLDITVLLEFSKESVLQVVNELISGNEGEYVKRFRVPWAKWSSKTIIPTNLDGEPIKAKEIHFEVQPKTIALVLPENCPLIQ